MTSLHSALRDITALVGGGISELRTDDPDMGRVLNGVLSDLQAADPDDVLVAFLGVTIALTERLAQHAGTTPTDYWNRTAAGMSARLAELENRA